VVFLHNDKPFSCCSRSVTRKLAASVIKSLCHAFIVVFLPLAKESARLFLY
jgi:hypothetical protein